MKNIQHKYRECTTCNYWVPTYATYFSLSAAVLSTAEDPSSAVDIIVGILVKGRSRLPNQTAMYNLSLASCIPHRPASISCHISSLISAKIHLSYQWILQCAIQDHLLFVFVFLLLLELAILLPWRPPNCSTRRNCQVPSPFEGSETLIRSLLSKKNLSLSEICDLEHRMLSVSLFLGW